MRHRRKNKKFSRPRAQRKALIKSLARSLITYERIKTTEAKAKGIRPVVERLITWGKRGDLHSRRLAYRVLGSHKLVKKLFDDVALRFSDVQGGYTRIINAGYRKGDGARLSIIELTNIKETKEKPHISKEEQKDKDVEEKREIPEAESKKSFLSGIKRVFGRK